MIAALIRRVLSAQMFCGRCGKWTEIGPGAHCSECGL
jgi:hypothetical protein